LSADSRTRNIATLVHCCKIKKNVIVASQLYDVAYVQITVDNSSLFCMANEKTRRSSRV